MNLQKLKVHLSVYKSDVLKIKQNGIWRNKEYPHILPKDRELENLINKGYYEKLCDIAKQIQLHFCFNHLNSSQALAINLFGPILIEKDFSILQNNGIEISNYKCSKFEHKERGDGTAFDFYIKDEVKNIYFEVKYTEDTLKTKSKSKNNDDRWSKYYKERMTNILIDNTGAKERIFSEYQLWRNIARISNDNDIVVFVVPKERKDLVEEIKSAKKKIKPEYVNRIKILYVNDVCECGENHDKFSTHYTEFRKKYLNIN